MHTRERPRLTMRRAKTQNPPRTTRWDRVWPGSKRSCLAFWASCLALDVLTNVLSHQIRTAVVQRNDVVEPLTVLAATPQAWTACLRFHSFASATRLRKPKNDWTSPRYAVSKR